MSRWRATMRILLIDDEEELVTTIVDRLFLRNIEADYATTGAKGLEMITDKDYELVVIDLKMAGLSGFQTIEKMKQKKPSLKFIILTGHSDEEDYHRGLAAGAAFYLMKPTDIEMLVEKINQALNLEAETR
jgi:DNA-binding response OmpR family regulator